MSGSVGHFSISKGHPSLIFFSLGVQMFGPHAPMGRTIFRFGVRLIILAASFSSDLTVSQLPLCQSSVCSAGTFDVEGSVALRQLKARQRAAQFLSHATFGAQKEEVQDLADRMVQIGVRRACSEWIDDQFALPPSFQVDTIDQMMSDHGFTVDSEEYVTRYRYHAFYHNALKGPDQLRQRVAWALSQIFVISDRGGEFNDGAVNRDGVPHWYGPSNYYDKLVAGASGNYRQILEDISLHPVMGIYLSHLRNVKADPENNVFPDENYAREIMQLFSIGLHELHIDGRPKVDAEGNLIPTYDNDTIENLARVFTGLTYSRAEYFLYGEPRDLVSPMSMWEQHHDSNEKVLPSGAILPSHSAAVGDGMQDIRAALDDLVAHNNVAPFIAIRLIQRLVRSNPSRAYIRRVARAFNRSPEGIRGDLKATVKAVLMDPEAFRGIRVRSYRSPTRLSVESRGTQYSRLQEPMMRYLTMVRCLNPEVTYNGQRSSWMMMSRTQDELGQSPFGAPSVFNFYLPTYQPPGPLASAVATRRHPDPRLVAPEFQLMTTVMANRYANRIRYELYNGGIEFTHWSPTGNHNRSEIRYPFEQWVQRINDDPESVVDELNWLLCGGTLEDETKRVVVESMRDVVVARPWVSDHHRFTSILYAIVSSPDYVIRE